MEIISVLWLFSRHDILCIDERRGCVSLKVILDTNIYGRDFYMRGAQGQLLLQMCNIVVPEIIYDETLNLHRRKIRECGKQLESKADEYRRIAFQPLEVSTSDKYKEEDEHYEDFMLGFLLQNGSYEPSPYPEKVSHKEVVSRALQGKKPFKADGKDGYRDYLVWRSVLDEVAQSDEIVHFVSENTKDFADENDKNKLHPDLLDEMGDLHIDACKLKYWSSLKAFVDENVKPELAKVEEEKQTISNLLNNERFIAWVNEYLREQLVGRVVCGYDVFVPGETPRIDTLENEEIEIREIAETEGGKYLISGMVDCWAEVISYISKQEFATWSDEDMEGSSVEEDRSNMLIRTFLPLDVEIEIISDASGNEIFAAEVTDVSDGRYCEYCPYD